MKYDEWLNKANQNIIKSLATCFNNSHLDGWSENHITTKVLSSLEPLGLTIDWEDRPHIVKWEGFKLKGSGENAYGDIAILVRVWVSKEKFFDGVAFYEAKRQYFDQWWNPLGFSSIKQCQSERLLSSSCASYFLLYDVDIEAKTARSTSVSTSFVNELSKAKLASNSGRLLHHYGEQWVLSLGKHFLGMNLDFSPKAVNEIKTLSATKRKPVALINVAVGLTNLADPVLDHTFENLKSYDKWLKEDEQKPDDEPTPEDDDPDFRMR